MTHERPARPDGSSPLPPSGGDLHEETDLERPPPGVHGMAIFRWILIALMTVIAALSLTHSFGLVSSESAGASSVQYYCPMHPQIVQDHPGECPICSMTLVKKESSSNERSSKGAADMGQNTAEEAGSHTGHRHNPADPYYCPMHPEETGLDGAARCPVCGMKLEKRAAEEKPKSQPVREGAMPPTPNVATDRGMGAAEGVPGLVPVELSMDRVQTIGVRTAAATLEELASEIRTVGFVSADESRLARVHTRFSGWIEQLAVAETGQKVSRGQVLAGLYNLELLPAQQEFLAARRWSSNTAPGLKGPAPTVGASLEGDARTRLELFGMSALEIDRIAQTGKPTRTVAVTSPIGGYVISKNAVEGAYVQPGTQLFEIADLSKIWVLADVYEQDVRRVSLGQAAEVFAEAHPNESFSGKIGFIYPVVDPSTRTLRVRIELANEGLKLRPGMYANVVIRLEAARGVVIPAEALADTGEHQYVFLAKAGGRFEPRRVRAGHRSGDKVQILDGLSPGELVVTSSSFLIDSESRLRATIEGTSEPGAAPAVPSACDADFDKTKFPDKHAQCRECERGHRGMGTMEEDCKNAIPRPWR